MALKCLGSLLKHSQEPIRFLLHDDGSLQDKDIALLSQHLCSPRIIAKREADKQMAEVLDKYPATLKFRQTDVLAKKLLDCVHFSSGDLFAYYDTDIYFFRPIHNPFVLPNEETGALFLKDDIHPYSIRLRDFAAATDIAIPQFINTGMICFRRSLYDLDFIEWQLRKKIMHSKPYFVEQTVWGLLGQRAMCRLWEPSQIVFMTPSARITRSAVAGHFVTPSRHLLEFFVETNDMLHHNVPVQVQTMSSKLCRPVDLAWLAAKSEAKRLLSVKVPGY